MTTPYDFLIDTFDTERLKTLSVWAQFTDADLRVRQLFTARTDPRQTQGGSLPMRRRRSMPILTSTPYSRRLRRW